MIDFGACVEMYHEIQLAERHSHLQKQTAGETVVQSDLLFVSTTLRTIIRVDRTSRLCCYGSQHSAKTSFLAFRVLLRGLRDSLHWQKIDALGRENSIVLLAVWLGICVLQAMSIQGISELVRAAVHIVSPNSNRQGHKFVIFGVRGRGTYRVLVGR